MHIKGKKKGYILLQNMVFLMVISFIGTWINKLAINNFMKSELYEVKNDRRTLEYEYEELLIEGEKYINSKEEIISNIKKKIENDSLGIAGDSFLYEYLFSKSKYKKIIISDKGVYIKQDSNDGSRYMLLDYKVKYDNDLEKDIVLLISSYYKTEFIIM